MSWLTEFAGKAEELLNKIDQNAASVIQETAQKGSKSSKGLTEVIATNGSDPVISTPTSSGFHQPLPKSTASPPVTTRSTEDALIEFLNDSTMDGFSEVDNWSVKGQENELDTSGDTMSSGQTKFEPTISKSSPDHQSESSLAMENQLLRTEIASLNQEMSTVLNRAKTAEKALTEARNESLRLSTEGRERLRRVQQLEEERVELEQKLTEMEAQHRQQREELSSALDGSRNELEQSKAKVEQGFEEERRQQQELVEQMERRERAANETIKAFELEISRIQAQLAKCEDEKAWHMSKTQELILSLNAIKVELEAARGQHEEYKVKAKKVLWEKEKLIDTLRSGGDLENGQEVEDAELQQALRERDLLKDEASQLSTELSAAKMDLSDVDRQLQEVQEQKARLQREAVEQVEMLRVNLQTSERELTRTKEDLRYLQEESTRQKSSFMATLNEKEVEMENLKAEMMSVNKLASNASGLDQTTSDLEQRVKTLTESLLQKQTFLERMTSEKNSLVLKMERMEAERETELRSRSVASRTPGGQGGDPAETLGFLQESPFDSKVSRGVKRAYSGLDKLSIRIGQTLRYYPTVRIFTIAYLALLQFWICLILFQAIPDPNQK